jgi:hypothetical protein
MPRLGGIHYRAMFRFSIFRGSCGYQGEPDARLHRTAFNDEIGGSCGNAELPSFWCVCRAAAGATENEASCLSTGERSNRWPFACGKAHSRRLVFAMPFVC